MENVIIIGILVAIVVGISFFLLRAKKGGKSCVGCPYAKQCRSKCNSCSGGNVSNLSSKELTSDELKSTEQ